MLHNIGPSVSKFILLAASCKGTVFRWSVLLDGRFCWFSKSRPMPEVKPGMKPCFEGRHSNECKDAVMLPPGPVKVPVECYLRCCMDQYELWRVQGTRWKCAARSCVAGIPAQRRPSADPPENLQCIAILCMMHKPTRVGDLRGVLPGPPAGGCCFIRPSSCTAHLVGGSEWRQSTNDFSASECQ